MKQWNGIHTSFFPNLNSAIIRGLYSESSILSSVCKSQNYLTGNSGVALNYSCQNHSLKILGDIRCTFVLSQAELNQSLLHGIIQCHHKKRKTWWGQHRARGPFTSHNAVFLSTSGVHGLSNLDSKLGSSFQIKDDFRHLRFLPLCAQFCFTFRLLLHGTFGTFQISTL